jgi:hypothetical protein
VRGGSRTEQLEAGGFSKLWKWIGGEFCARSAAGRGSVAEENALAR